MLLLQAAYQQKLEVLEPLFPDLDYWIFSLKQILSFLGIFRNKG